MGRVNSDLCVRGAGARLESITIGMRSFSAGSREGGASVQAVQQKSRPINEESREASGASSRHTCVSSAPSQMGAYFWKLRN